MANPYGAHHASTAAHKAEKEPKVPKVKSARSVISEVACEGAKGRIGKETAKRILAALEHSGLEIASKPYVKPVEAKRKEEPKHH